MAGFWARLVEMKRHLSFKHPGYPLWRWAKRVEVTETADNEYLQLRGEPPAHWSGRGSTSQAASGPPDSSADLFYYFSYAGSEHAKARPHVQFANATDDQKLKAFTRKFGPVWLPPKGRFDLSKSDAEGCLWAYEHLESLRQEQRAFRALAAIIATLTTPARPRKACENLNTPQRRKACARQRDQEEIAANLTTLALDWTDEEAKLKVLLLGSAPRLTRDSLRKESREKTIELVIAALRDGQFGFEGTTARTCIPIYGVLMHVLNAFPKRLVAHYGPPRVIVELPETTIDGIRPALYNMLRTDLLNFGQARPELGLCEECGDFFSIGRLDKVYCSQKCASRFLSRRHWREKGKQHRLESKRKARARSPASMGQGRRPPAP